MAKTLAGSSDNLFEERCSADEAVPTLSAVHISRGSGAKKTISDLHFPEAILAVKESASCHDLKELQSRLISRLGQNSQETRLRYTRFLIRWFFADGLDGLARKVWIAYQDEKILTDILRFLYLSRA